MAWMGTLAFRRRGRVLIVGAVVLAVAGWGASKLIVNDARILAFKDDHLIVRATDAINERFDGTSHLNLVVTPAEGRSFLEAELLRKVQGLEEFTEDKESRRRD